MHRARAGPFIIIIIIPQTHSARTRHEPPSSVQAVPAAAAAAAALRVRFTCVCMRSVDGEGLGFFFFFYDG